MSYIFISHATADDGAVDRIFDAFSAAGIETWVDHHVLKPGVDWEAGIQKGLVECEAGLFVLSPRSFDRVECRNEIRTILDLKRPLYVALIENVPPENFPYRLRTVQYASLAHDWNAGIKALIEAMTGKRELDPQAPTVEHIRVISGRLDPRLTTIPMSGRDADLAAVIDHLRDQPVAILGVGGLGKSRLAAEVARTDAQVQGVIWHVASDSSRADEIIDLLREHFKLPANIDPRDVLQSLRETPTLIVIDNAESVEDGERRTAYIALIGDLVNHKAQVLLTARVEWEDLPLVYNYHPQQLQIEAARQIVVDMGRIFGAPDLAPHAEALAKAARQHPRLIEWAVRKTSKFPPAKVIVELNELRSDDVQKSLRDMILKTVAQMTAAEGEAAAAALKRLNVCRGGFTYEAAQAILELETDADTLDAWLTELQAWQFVTLRNSRYEIDALVIASVGEDESAYRAHYAYYYALAWQHERQQDYYGLDVESANLEAAFNRAIQNDAEAALWLFNGCGMFLGNRGRYQQRLEWIERVVAALETNPNEGLRAEAQNSLGAISGEHPFGDRSANLYGAVAAYQQALRYRTPDKNPQDYATTQNNLGTVYRSLAALEDREGNLHRSVDAYQQALLYRTSQSAPLEYAMTQNNLGNAYRDLGRLEDHSLSERGESLRHAIDAYQQALLYRTPEAARLAYAQTHYNLGIVYTDLAELEDQEDNRERAITAYQQALRFYTPQTAPLAYAQTNQNLGFIYKGMGAMPAAVACWQEAERYYRLMGYTDDAEKLLGWIASAEQPGDSGSA